MSGPGPVEDSGASGAQTAATTVVLPAYGRAPLVELAVAGVPAQSDPHWRDLILFYEYFHGDNGAGLGASHQTGWTGLVAKFIELYGLLGPERALAVGKQAVFVQGDRNAAREPAS